MRIVISSVIVLIGMIAMMAGIGILNLASLLEESGLPRRYQSTQSANIHDSYFTIDLFGFIPIAGIPDVRIGRLAVDWRFDPDVLRGGCVAFQISRNKEQIGLTS